MARISLARSAISTLALVLLANACKPLDRGAREQFSRGHSCPMDRVEVRRRTDVKAWDVSFGSRGPTRPPDELARDPERLALWRKTEREKQDGWNDDYELRGCGAQALVSCNHPVEADGAFTGRVSCHQGEFPAGSRTPW